MALQGVVGTAGHIDHGKTSLVRALTGIDTDRLKEEKARGITIELGFAHLQLPSGRVVGVVDVPGHERFVRTMVAGAVGIDLVVLVVAADEGVMPQTREHLDICALLGVSRGIVALSKSDLVGPELRALVEGDVRATLAGTFLDGAEIIACSTRTEEGLPALRLAIERAFEASSRGTASPFGRNEGQASSRGTASPFGRKEGQAYSRGTASPFGRKEGQASSRGTAWPAPSRGATGLLRLPIDRVFSMKGFGSVVTGTLWSGRVAIGDEVGLPGGAGGRVRGVQVHGAPVEHIEAGSRVALNVAMSRDALARGAMLGHAGALEQSRVFDAALRILPSTKRALKRRSRVLLHAGTTQVDAVVRLLEGESLAPGATAVVEVETHEPLVLVPGDRFVLRGFETQKDHGTTLGGGVVVRVLGARSRRHHRTEPALVRANLDAHACGDAVERTRLEIARAGERGIDRTALRRRLPWSERVLDDALATLRSAQRALQLDDVLIDAEVLATLEARAADAVLAKGELPRESLRVTVGELLPLVVGRLVVRGTIREDRDLLRAPMTIVDEAAAKLEALLAKGGLEPPRIVELPALLGGTPASIEKTIAGLVREGRAVRLKELCYAKPVVEELQRHLVAYLEAHGTITPQAWKTLTGVSRKFGIPLAEHFDATRVTLRVGDDRKLRR